MNGKKIHPWAWIPSLYFAQGLPYEVVMRVAVVMYKRLGIANADIALYTSLLGIPWIIKPFWSPIVDILKTKRWWMVAMQLIIGAGMAGVALSIPAPFFFRATMAFFVLLAFSSATHDISIDGFYMLALTPFQQSYFIGIRSTFYRTAMITGQGILVMFAGWMEKVTESVPAAWCITFVLVAVLFVLLSVYHYFMLPRVETVKNKDAQTFKAVLHEFAGTFVSFFRKKGIAPAIAFFLLYRLSEAQLVKIASLFMLDKPHLGGLGLETGMVGFTYGTVGVIALVLGGITGGIAISLKGLKFWLAPMMIAMNLPNLVYVYLSFTQTQALWLINAAVAVEQFGYGFGFSAYLLFMIYMSDGPYKTAHYAICTALMALGLMLPGMVAGWLQEWLGYKLFFIWVMLCTVPPFFVLPFLHIHRHFGMKNSPK
ncbi:MAG: MFS transporter [Bacteroidales bacterium]|jgi:PAT family beta-lactamase induction signal transducer AmpG|nr:MFS transporter [Bacteroidales bacterium]